MSNIIKGKKVTTQADAIAKDIKALGQQGAGLQKSAISELNKPAAGMEAAILGRKAKLARASGADAERQAKKLAAQRGMGSSSIGLGMQQQASQRTADKLADIRSQKGQLARQFAQEKFNLGSGLISQRGPIKMKATTVRKGGMGKILGMAAGAALGGPAGAQMGGQIGGALQDS